MESGSGKALLEMEVEEGTHSGGREICITEDHAERRVDRICRTLYKHVPLGAIMRAIRKGDVRLDGRRTKPDARPAAGQILRVPWEELPEKPSKGEGARETGKRVSQGNHALRNVQSVTILYQDEHLLVVDKPWGLLTQPDVKGGDSLITRIWEMIPARRDFRPVPVHRLDRNTSGILLVALNGSLLRELHALWKEERISKIYRTVVAGNPGKAGEIAEPLWKDERENRVYVDPRGVPALTRYRTLAYDGRFSLLEVELCTGRSHQIRVHLAHRGCPVVGDYKYGDEKINKDVRNREIFRPLLHAFRMVFPSMPSPWKNLSERVFICAPPCDFTEFFPEAAF